MVERIGFFFTLLSLVSITFNGVRVHAHMTLSDVFFTIAGILALGLLLTKPRRLYGFPLRFFGAVAWITITGVISSILSVEPEESFLRLAALLISLMCVPVIIYIYATSMQRMWLLTNAWVLGATLNAIIAIGDFFGGSVLASILVDREFSGRAIGLATHPSHFGIICAMAIPVVLTTSSLRDISRISRILFSTATFLLMIGVLISGSRAALGASAVGVAITVIANRTIRKKLLLVIVCVSLIGSLTSIFINLDQQLNKNVFLSLTRSIGTEDAMRATKSRLNQYSIAVDTFVENPFFGIGLVEFTRWHNIYLQILVSFGIFGLTGFLLLLRSFLLLLLSLYKKVRTTRHIHHTFILALTASTVVWAVAGLFQNMMLDRYVYIPMSILFIVRGVLWLNKRSQASLLKGGT